MKTIARAAFGAALLTAAIPLSTGTAAAQNIQIDLMYMDPGRYSCELSTETCWISVVYLTDLTTPVTISVDGTVIGTPTPGTGCWCTPETAWIPPKGGRYTLTATQGSQKATKTVTIGDYNGLQGIVQRYLGIDTGSGS
ncbi:hypothetical protein ACFYUD_27795 [Nocardia tengchongensis]|uniref:hypothetical protein n=1 Tax=Nocardia tengchongensis TaxID=2055889 RepID=UPI00369DEF23